MSTRYHIIPIFVPHVGCPHDCIFCNQRKIAQSKSYIDENIVIDTIEKYLKTIPHTNEKLEIAFFGGSFTGIDIDIQRRLLGIAYNYKSKGYIDRIRLSTRPDYIDFERLSILKQYDVDIIELGVQSMCPDVLQKSFRGHSDIDVISGSMLIKDFGFILGLQMMVGLPGSNYEKEIYTAKKLIDLKPGIVRIYPTLVIKDTYLEKMFYNKTYIPLTLDSAIETCSDLLMLFNYYGINVIRIGLQPTDNIAENKDVVAGPFHPAFRQLVEEKIYRRYLEMFFKVNKEIEKELEICINKKEISNFVGQCSSNINFLKTNYGIDRIKVIGKDMEKFSFLIRSKNTVKEIKTKEYMENYLVKKGLIFNN